MLCINGDLDAAMISIDNGAYFNNIDVVSLWWGVIPCVDFSVVISKI